MAAEQVLELELAVDYDAEDGLMLDHLPASTQWLAAIHGRDRAYGKAKGKEEWKYFNDNVTKYQHISGQSDEADNYSSIAFSTFADEWNKWVAALGRTYPAVTYKTASQLQEAFKRAKKHATEKATLRPYRQNLDVLQQGLRDEEENQNFVPMFVPPNGVYRAVPIPPATSVQETQTEISYSYAQPLTATPVAHVAPAESALADPIAPPTNPPLAEPLGTPVVVAHADPVATPTGLPLAEPFETPTKVTDNKRAGK